MGRRSQGRQLTPRKTRRIRVRWDTESDGRTIPPSRTGLPSEVDVPSAIPDDRIADWLSDRYGWCVHGWRDPSPRGRPPKAAR